MYSSLIYQRKKEKKKLSRNKFYFESQEMPLHMFKCHFFTEFYLIFFHCCETICLGTIIINSHSPYVGNISKVLSFVLKSLMNT